MGEGDDIADLAAKAKVLAEASGRSEEEVMADLLDDGKNHTYKWVDRYGHDTIDLIAGADKNHTYK